MSAKIGFLHTTPVHAATVRALLAAMVPGSPLFTPSTRASRSPRPALVIVAAVESTLAPTLAPVEECGAGLPIEVRYAPCRDAWSRFEAGDLNGYSARLADHVRSVASQADVVFLAQGSMAPVESLVRDGDAHVLSSSRRRSPPPLISWQPSLPARPPNIRPHT